MQAQTNQAMAEALTHLTELALVVLLVGVILSAGVVVVLFVISARKP